MHGVYLAGHWCCSTCGRTVPCFALLHVAGGPRHAFARRSFRFSKPCAFLRQVFGVARHAIEWFHVSRCNASSCAAAHCNLALSDCPWPSSHGRFLEPCSAASAWVRHCDAPERVRLWLRAFFRLFPLPVRCGPPNWQPTARAHSALCNSDGRLSPVALASCVTLQTRCAPLEAF